MPWTLFSADDVKKMDTAWQNRSQEVFIEKVIKDFVELHMDRAISRDIHGQMLKQIKDARTPKDLEVSSGLCYEPNHRFYVGRQWMSIKQLLYRTDALKRLEAELGPQIKVRPSYWNDLIYIMIEFWPTRV